MFWNVDYAKSAKMERQPAIDKVKDLIGNVPKYISYGANNIETHF